MDPQKARLNPEAFSVYLPQEGIFRGSDGGPTIYRKVGNTVTAIDLTSLLTPEERQNAGSYGEQKNIALNKLKSQYGFDFNSVPSVNMADFIQSMSRQGLGYQTPDGQFIPQITKVSDVNQFITAPKANLNTEQLNTEKNTLANDTLTPPMGGGPTVKLPNVSLQPGQSGEDVRALQKWLIANGYQIPDGATGYYGAQTKAAIEKLQKSLGVNAGKDIGFFGPKTISAIKEEVPITNQSNPTQTQSTSNLNDGYYSVNGAYFQKLGGAITAVNDPAVINSIKSGATPANETNFNSLFSSRVAETIVPEEEKFFNSTEFKALSPDQQEAIRSVFNVVQTNDESKKNLLKTAIEKATQNADPIFKQTLKMSLDALDRGFMSIDDDAKYKEEQLTKRLNELREDTAYASNNLTIDQENELKSLERDYTSQLQGVRQNLAASGFTDSSRRAKTESILTETKGQLVESSGRKFAEKSRALTTGLSRTEADTQSEIQRLKNLATQNKTDLGRKVEEVIGSRNLPSLPGYNPLGNIIGTAEQKRQKDIDAAALDYYNLGFVM